MYNSHKSWQELNLLLPTDFQLKPENLPTEEFWNWQGNHVHLDCYRNSKATYRIFLHHGIGTNGRQLNIILGQKLAKLGYEVVAIDNLGHGMTKVNKKDVVYNDWVQLFADFVNAETKRSYKRAILFGFGTSGAVVYGASFLINEVHGIIGTCLLKNNETPLHNVIAKYKSILNLLVKAGLGRFPLAISWVFKMSTIFNDKAALNICLNDFTSAGAKLQLKFLYSYLTYQLPIPIDKYDKCPILILNTKRDTATPQQCIKETTSYKIRICQGAGSFSIEEENLKTLFNHTHEFISKCWHWHLLRDLALIEKLPG